MGVNISMTAKILNELTVTMLVAEYKRAVCSRTAGKPYGGMVSLPMVERVAVTLMRPEFAVLFIEAQFEVLSINFCREHFFRSYPPPNVVFGKKSMIRYYEYINKGDRAGRYM